MIETPYSRAMVRRILDSMKANRDVFEPGDAWDEEWLSTMVIVRVKRADTTIQWDPFLLCPVEEEEARKPSRLMPVSWKAASRLRLISAQARETP